MTENPNTIVLCEEGQNSDQQKLTFKKNLNPAKYFF